MANPKAKASAVNAAPPKPYVRFEPVPGCAPWEVVFTRQGEKVSHTYGPFARFEDAPLERNALGLRGLLGVHGGGTELLAAQPADASGGGWQIVFDAIEGLWDATYRPMAL